MLQADCVLDTAIDALGSHGKIAPKVKKMRILPLIDEVDALRVQIAEARKNEQDMRRQERYEEWLHREEGSMCEERQALRPIAQRRIQERTTELRVWAREEEWAR